MATLYSALPKSSVYAQHLFHEAAKTQSSRPSERAKTLLHRKAQSHIGMTARPHSNSKGCVAMHAFASKRAGAPYGRASVRMQSSDDSGDSETTDGKVE
eukprot:CAMPEP_0198202764 /NCGR_PEP_ID=MMETSP1445-20131203/5978_1 /TAXON_ID=36898 /ORGANISM="Pyramimonas sp., Strain CCMP2087" /LENGTH=98 /DNA_ID=CAMNT_0043873841 /DNA_START=16 /DNA_END=309 /DNA_ORIENTATION=+